MTRGVDNELRSDEVELEVEAPEIGLFRLHVACFKAWDFELREAHAPIVCCEGTPPASRLDHAGHESETSRGRTK